MIKQKCMLFVLCVLCPLTQALAGQKQISQQTPQQVQQQVLQKAEQLQLGSHETWLALLHYKREILSRRFISQADDKRFFLAENGDVDAGAELRADIIAFLHPGDDGKPHAQCLFPARWWWLKQQLAITDNFDVACPKLDAFMQRVAHDKLFLVFPSMYLNNPGSTFGHTFLRFDDEQRSILLSQTLNYAARVDHSDNLVSYIGKGLFGGYTGFFRARPYFETVQEYSNIENRDIWEYQLNFTDAEIEQLVRHVWEVKGIDFDYYFFRENCAYRLLALIDVIRPGMALTGEDKFQLYAIPVDTVRALDAMKLIKSRQFRASLATQINENFAEDNHPHAALVIEIAESEIPARLVVGPQEKPVNSSPDVQHVSDLLQVISARKIRLEVLQQSYKILQFDGRSSSVRAQSILQLMNEIALTSEKSRLDNAVVNLNDTSITLEAGGEKIKDGDSLKRTSPERGHDSLRLAPGYGEQNNQSYIDLKFRPAFHDLLDDAQGYVNGAAINLLETQLKWFVNNSSANPLTQDSEPGNKLRLERLSLFNVTSLNPLSTWQKPISWTLDFSFDRTQLDQTTSVRNFISRGSVGVSMRGYGLTPYVMLLGEWNLASAYEKGYSLLIGAQAGVHLKVKSNQLLLSYQRDDAVSGFDMGRKISRFQWQYNVQLNHALRVQYRYTDYPFYNDEDWSFNYNYYF